MAIILDHLIVPSQDPLKSAKNIADLLDVAWEKNCGPFTEVYINDHLTLAFDDRFENFNMHHYCFQVGEEDFNAIFSRITKAGILYRSTPTGPDDMKINTRLGGRNIYWTDDDGHFWEILTVSYARQKNRE